MRIASYNIRKARGLDQRRAPERTLEVINRLDADVVALQEADKRLGDRPTALPRRMIESETDFRVVEVAANDVSIGWHGNAVLVRKDAGAVGSTAIDLPGLEPRGAVRIDFDGGFAFSLIATHLGLLRQSRLMQLEALATAACSQRPTIIAGDFNEWSETRGLEPLQDQFTIHSPGRSFHARRPVAGLDRFAMSHGVELRDAGVDQSPLASRASDHLPIWADVTVG